MPLLLVGTPIGNLKDMSLRGVEALQKADAIYCEDTRVTARLAARFGLAAPRFSCHEHNEARRIPEILHRLQTGETVVLVSDAGLPGLSDPGDALVRAAAEAGFAISVVPGPSAPAAALAVSGLPAVPHLFLGFPPARRAERRRFFARYRECSETLVWFEAPHRLSASLADAAETFGHRRACLCRELTKLHEEVVHRSLPELAEMFAGQKRVRGEITIVAEGQRPTSDGRRATVDGTEERAANQIRKLARRGLSKREIAREIARKTGRPSREIYALLIKG